MRKIFVFTCLVINLLAPNNPVKNVDYGCYFFKRLIQYESNWKPDARGYNEKGKLIAIGLGQITRPMLKDFNLALDLKIRFKECYDPSTNLWIATWGIKHLLKRFGYDVVKAVNSYTMGEGNTRKGLYFLPYLRKVLGVWELHRFLKGKKIKAVRRKDKKLSKKRFYVVET